MIAGVPTPSPEALRPRSASVQNPYASHTAVDAGQAPPSLDTVMASSPPAADASSSSVPLSRLAKVAGMLAFSAAVLGAGTFTHAPSLPSMELDLSSSTTTSSPVEFTGNPIHDMGQIKPHSRVALDGDVKVFGQTVSDGKVKTDDWATYSGTHSGKDFSFKYPKGWKVTNLTLGTACYDPNDPNSLVVFSWGNGAGTNTPQGYINQLIAQAGGSNYHIVNQQMKGPYQTQMGPLYDLEQTATYNYEGTVVKTRFTSAVANMVQPYLSTWYGNAIIRQAQSSKFDKVSPILEQIASSFGS